MGSKGSIEMHKKSYNHLFFNIIPKYDKILSYGFNPLSHLISHQFLIPISLHKIPHHNNTKNQVVKIKYQFRFFNTRSLRILLLNTPSCSSSMNSFKYNSKYSLFFIRVLFKYSSRFVFWIAFFTYYRKIYFALLIFYTLFFMYNSFIPNCFSSLSFPFGSTSPNTTWMILFAFTFDL